MSTQTLSATSAALLDSAAPSAAVQEQAGVPSQCTARQFNLLRWFSRLGLASIAVIGALLAVILSHFMQREILNHDAELTSQFVASIVEAQINHASIASGISLSQILDDRTDLTKLGVEPQVARGVRVQFYDHLRLLKDVLLAEVIAPDHTIIWSNNRSVVGTREPASERLDDAFAAHGLATMHYVGSTPAERETLFLRQPDKLYVENFVPLKDRQNGVAMLVKIYKEPSSLVRAIHFGYLLVWSGVALSAVLLYLALLWGIRRADALLQVQRERLVEMEALCVIGEMSAAVAHGIRNPLAAIRSSAELSLDGDLASARRNSANIIIQIDRLGKWVRDLLVFSRPLLGENQKLDLAQLAEETLHCFSTQLDQKRVACEFVRPPAEFPCVIGNFALASQTLAILVSNAIEAMPGGGLLRLEIHATDLPSSVRLDVVDQGTGMSPAELDLVFKPYYTTKHNGLGLGMALAKRIMERFGGAIHLQSRKDVGTRASLFFKVA